MDTQCIVNSSCVFVDTEVVICKNSGSRKDKLCKSHRCSGSKAVKMHVCVFVYRYVFPYSLAVIKFAVSLIDLFSYSVKQNPFSSNRLL